MMIISVLLTKYTSVTIEMVNHKLCPEIVQSLSCRREGKRSGASFLRPQVNSVCNGEQSLRSFGPVGYYACW